MRRLCLCPTNNQISEIRRFCPTNIQISQMRCLCPIDHQISEIRCFCPTNRQISEIRCLLSHSKPLLSFCVCVCFFFFYFEPPLRPGINSHPCAEVLQFHMDHSSSGLNLVQKLDTITLKYSELPLNFFSFWRPFMSFLNIAAHLEQIISVIPGLEQK